MPADDGLGPEDQQSAFPTGPASLEGDPDPSISWAELGFVVVTVEHRNLVSQGQDLQGELVLEPEPRKEVMQKHGYEEAQSILNEWNYVRGWSSEFVYSIRTIIGQKGAAFTTACMCACQDAPVDILMYYDARPTAFNGLFDYYTFAPLKGDYPFLAWSKLAALGTEASCAIMDDKDIYATAAVNKDGKLAILVCRYSDDDSVQGAKPVTVRLKEGSLEGARCTITDSSFTFAEIPAATKNGALELMLEPNAFVLIDR